MPKIRADQLDYQTDGTPQRHSAHAEAVTDLVHEALARLCAQSQRTGRPPKGQGPLPDGARADEVIGDPLSAALAYALCDDEPDGAQAIVDDLLDAGVSVPDLCLDHLAPAARHLGVWWDMDRVPFTDVTLATARIQSMLLRLPASGDGPRQSESCSAFFAAVPGEEHTLGVMMAADLFRRNGWDVGVMVGVEYEELLDRISRDDRPVIGLSCGGDHSFPGLKRLMAAIRRSRPGARILISGQITASQARLDDLKQPFIAIRSAADGQRAMMSLAADFRAADRMARGSKQSG